MRGWVESERVRLRPAPLLWVLLLAVPGSGKNAAAQALELSQSDAAIAVRQDGRLVLVYNIQPPPAPEGIDPVYRRSGFLHPVASPKGRVVTQAFPVDHPHQHGIFTAWVRTTYGGKPVDFWNLAGGTGRVLHERVVSRFEEGEAIGFEVDLLHRMTATPPVDVLRERWKVTVYPTDGDYHCFDLETTQTALTDTPLIVEKYHYGGVALRGPTRWLTEQDGFVRRNSDQVCEPSRFLNNLGSGRVEGNHEHAKWVAMTGAIDGEPVTIAVLCHADNFRAPQAARLHPTKPYFVFAPCVDGEFVIDREHPFQSRYRYLITDAEPDAEWLDDKWREWCSTDK
ncbi:MAG: PmoA family protein [Planctomycetes bacterium]|nr:PmoA family protein [Planctomycetota bacterium]